MSHLESALDALDVIEKARGLLGPKGTRGALRALRGAANNLKTPRGKRADRASNYLMTRLAGQAPHRAKSWSSPGYQRRGFYKSLEQLDAVIEKAKGLINGGSRAAFKRMANAEQRSFKRLRSDAKTGKPNNFKRQRAAANFLAGRRKGAGWAEGKLFRTGKYK